MKLRVKNTVFIGFAFLSIMLLWTGYNWFVPIFLNDKLEELFINWLGNTSLAKFCVGAVMGMDNLLALFMIPLISKISDRTNSKIGKRMPFIIIGMCIAMLSFAALPLVAHGNFILLALVLLLIMVSMNVYRSPAVALMPDITPKPLRARGNAIINIMGGIGTGLGYIICFICSDGIANTSEIVPIEIIAAVMFICLAVIIFTVKEKEFKAQMLIDVKEHCEHTGESINDYIGESDEDEQYVSDKQETTKQDKKNLMLMLTAILFYYMATNSVETFMSIYSREVLGSETFGLIALAALAVGNFAFMIPSALLAEKLGRNKIMLIGSILMLVSNLSLVFVSGFSYLLLIPFFIFGIGMSIMVTNMYPAIVNFCSKGDYARFTGYYYTSTMLAQSITPALAGFFMASYFGGGTKNLMPYAAVFSFLCFITLLFVSKDSNKNTKQR